MRKLFIIPGLALALAGCAKNYTVTTPAYSGGSYDRGGQQQQQQMAVGVGGGGSAYRVEGAGYPTYGIQPPVAPQSQPIIVIDHGE